MSEGFIVELADGGPWLRLDGTWTPDYEERGVWQDESEAERVARLSLEGEVK